MASTVSEGIKATKREPEDLKKIAEHFKQIVDLDLVTAREFKQEYRAVEAALREKYNDLADTLEYDPSLKPYLVVILKSLTQITSDLGTIGDKPKTELK
jgi:hypothetical protein